MEVAADFYSDFIKFNLNTIAELKKQGFKFEEYKNWKRRKLRTIKDFLYSKKTYIQETDLINDYNYDLVFDFVNWMERIPDPIPRLVHKCRDFTCPEKYQAGLNLIEKGIKNGYNLLPFLSRQIYDAKENDRMLFTLGITHFHLGKEQDKEKPLLVKGTKDILYSFIHKKDCYFIVIDKHGRWDDEELLRILYKDFPEALKSWKLEKVTPDNLTDNDKKEIRRKNITTMITINNETYIPPGWGTSMNGTSVNARLNLDRFIRYLDSLEKNLILTLNENKEKIEKDFNIKIERMNLFLYQTDPIKILEKESNLIININNFNGDNLSINITNNFSNDI